MNNRELQERLVALFEEAGVDVAVGLLADRGVAIRSQDGGVDAQNIGTVKALGKTKMAETVRVTRRDGRIWKVEVLDAQRDVLCELPLTGVTLCETAKGASVATLRMWGGRLEYSDGRRA